MREQRVRAHEFKRNMGDTYKAAERGPVLIVRGRGPSTVNDDVSHVLMTWTHYQTLLGGQP